MVGGIITILGGLLAASGFILAKRPDTRPMFDKLAPYQGWIGITMFFWGIWESLGVLRSVSMLGVSPLLWIFWALSGACDLSVGFLLGFGLIAHYALAGSAEARAKGEQLRGRLATIQGPLGLVTIIMGALYTLFVVMT